MKNTVSIVTSLILAVAALSLPVLAQDHQGTAISTACIPRNKRRRP